MRRSFQEISHKDNKILPGSDSGPLCDPSRIRTDAERARGANGSSPSRSLSHSLSLSLSAECSNALLSSLSPFSFYASPCPLPHSLSLSLSLPTRYFIYLFSFRPALRASDGPFALFATASGGSWINDELNTRSLPPLLIAQSLLIRLGLWLQNNPVDWQSRPVWSLKKRRDAMHCAPKPRITRVATWIRANDASSDHSDAAGAARAAWSSNTPD